ncbi:unnamed protein product [Echinostoma caproni]|uniref:Protein FAM184A-like n=1 Tax=Echinostoma caproni TaxID=27848 RepID=A0A183AQ72_9TREM|nr:unnamed protein product [Echinostoma caproni]
MESVNEELILTGSEAVAVTAVILDAVTELKTLINLIDIRKTQIPNQRGVQPQSNNSAAIESDHLESTIEDLFNSKTYTEKLKTDMIQVTEILAQLAEELDKKGTFQVLEEAVKREEDKYREIEKILERERVMRARIKGLRHGIENNLREGQQLIEKSKETIAHLKDQVQEMKARSVMEERYMTQYSQVRLAELESRFDAKKQELVDEIGRINLLRDQETRASEETKSYLRDRLAELNQLEEFWRTRSENDVRELRHKLDILKSGKTKDLNRLHELTLQVSFSRVASYYL